MATGKKDEKKSPSSQNARPRKSGKLKFFTLAIISGLSLLFVMPSFILVMAGMIPTLVSLVTDDDKEKSPTVAIGSMNFVGTLPFLIDLWSRGQTIGNVVNIMSQMTTWVVIFGAAAMGKLIIFAVPQATATITLANAERRLKLLNENLNSLKAAWGPDVATTKPLNSLRSNE